jgi:hypothetical protein
MTRQTRVFLFDQEFSTEGHEDRKGLFSSRPLRPSVQSERKAAGSRIHSMNSMMRTGSGSPCVIHRLQKKAKVDQALARRLKILAVKASRIKR